MRKSDVIEMWALVINEMQVNLTVKAEDLKRKMLEFNETKKRTAKSPNVKIVIPYTEVDSEGREIKC